MDLRAFPGRGELFESLAEELARDVEDARGRRDEFAWVLAGGSTPRGFYETLTRAPWAIRLGADRMQWFWGDERSVPPEDPTSNFGMAKAALLEHVLPGSEPAASSAAVSRNVHRICGELPPDIAAERYEALLRQRAIELADRDGVDPADAVLFDWVLLGLGADGHTASLFPGGAWSGDPERWVRAEQVPHLGWRVTLTPAALRRTRRVVFLVTGAEKAEALRSVLEGPYRPDRWPAQIVARSRVPVSFRVDAPAAARLSSGPSRS